MYREGVCAVFSEREASSLAPATSWSQRDMCRFAWLDFRWETASLEAVVRRQDGALLLRRERAEARLWVYRLDTASLIMTDTRFERVTFVSDALPLRQSVEGMTTMDAAAVRSPAA